MKKIWPLLIYIISLDANSQIDLDPVTVTATLSNKKVSETGRNIITIKGEQFDNLPVHSIDELLRYIPGIETQQRGAMGSQSDIILRGGTFQQVLIILDGVRLNDPNTGHFNAYLPIAPSEIDRIEVLKGPASAIYGSEAVGGVIHIITKSFSAKSHETKQNVSARITAGEYSFINAEAGGYFQEKHNTVALGVLTNHSKGLPQRGINGFFHNTTGSVSYKRFFGKHWDLSLRSSMDIRDFSAQNFYTSFVSDTAEEQVISYWYQARLQYQQGKNRLSFDQGYKKVSDEYQYNRSALANSNHSSMLQSNLIWEYGDFISGIRYIYKGIRSNDRGDHHKNQFAAYGIWNKKFSKHIFISPALRFDQDAFIPQLNISFRNQKFQLRASAGKTIRQADFTERYNNYNKVFVSGGSIGNPELDPERSFSYEVGGDIFLQHWKISATSFRRDQKNVIDWTPTPYTNMPRKVNLSPTGSYALASNIAKVNTSGIETDIQFQSKNIMATLGLVWLNSDVNGAPSSFYISSHAKFLTNFSFRYALKRFVLSTTAIYKNRAPQKATAINVALDEHCFMISGKLEYFILKNKFTGFIEVDNIFDEQCRDLLGSQRPGRWIMGGLKFNWNK